VHPARDRPCAVFQFRGYLYPARSGRTSLCSGLLTCERIFRRDDVFAFSNGDQRNSSLALDVIRLHEDAPAGGAAVGLFVLQAAQFCLDLLDRR
jgi:hypothetical protein